jgi:hypothetical protein
MVLKPVAAKRLRARGGMHLREGLALHAFSGVDFPLDQKRIRSAVIPAVCQISIRLPHMPRAPLPKDVPPFAKGSDEASATAMACVTIAIVAGVAASLPWLDRRRALQFAFPFST